MLPEPSADEGSLGVARRVAGIVFVIRGIAGCSRIAPETDSPPSDTQAADIAETTIDSDRADVVDAVVDDAVEVRDAEVLKSPCPGPPVVGALCFLDSPATGERCAYFGATDTNMGTFCACAAERFTECHLEFLAIKAADYCRPHATCDDYLGACKISATSCVQSCVCPKGGTGHCTRDACTGA